MNCPHCQRELPENHGAAWCPYCGKDLADAFVSSSGNIPKRRFPWLVFAIVMSAPAMADFILVNFISDSLDTLGTMMLISFVGSTISGIACGIILARWKGASGFRLFSQAIGFAFLMAIVSFGLCCLGCTASAAIQSAIQTMSK
jgi:hypothetical protein